MKKKFSDCSIKAKTISNIKCFNPEEIKAIKSFLKEMSKKFTNPPEPEQQDLKYK